MKKIGCIILVLTSLVSFSKSVKIEGIVNGGDGKKVELLSIVGKEQILVDTTYINNKAKFVISLLSNVKSGMYMLRFNKDDNKLLRLFINNEDIIFETNFDNIYNDLLFISSNENIAISEFYLNFNNYNNKINALSKLKYNFLSDDDFKSQSQEKLEQLVVGRKNYVENFFNDNRDLYITRYLKSSIDFNLIDGEANISKVFLSSVDFEDEGLINSNIFTDKVFSYMKLRLSQLRSKDQQQAIKLIIDEIGEYLDKNIVVRTHVATYLLSVFRDSGMEDVYIHIVDKFIDNDLCVTDKKDKYLKRANQFKRLAVGKIAPNIKFDQNLGGVFVDFYQIQSKRKLLVFWATDCPHCKEYMPGIYNLYKKYKNKGFEVVSISLGAVKSIYNAKIKNWNWLNYYPQSEWEAKEAKDYYVYATPTMFYINGKTNEILGKPVQVYQLENLLRKDFN
jgi:thiol-disulfide isomerase/thioredoxin